MPTVRPKASKVSGEPPSWQVLWRNGAAGRQQSCTFADPQVARRADRWVKKRKAEGAKPTDLEVYAHIHQIELPPEPERPSFTVQQVGAMWLDSRLTVTSDTAHGYAGHLQRRVYPAIGSRPIREVGSADITAILKRMRGDGYAAVTITRYYSTMHAMWAWAVREGHADTNPVERTDWARDVVDADDVQALEDRHVYLDDTEWLLVYAQAPTKTAAAFMWMMVNSGLRFGEGSAVTVADIHLDGDGRGDRRPFVLVRQAWKGTGPRRHLGVTKGRQRRKAWLPADPSTRRVLGPIVRGRPGDELAFHHPDGPGVALTNDWATDNWLAPAISAAMRCPEHPPPPPQRGRRRAPQEQLPPCGCRRRKATAATPCKCQRPSLAASTCECRTPPRLRRRFGWHDLRHTNAAWLLADPENAIAAISQHLGHKTTAVTELIYGGILPEAAGQLSDSLGRRSRRTAARRRRGGGGVTARGAV